MMKKVLLPAAANAAALCALTLLTGCGGGGGSDAPAGPPANRAPSLTASTLVTDEDVAGSAQLSGTDPDGDPLSFSLATNAQHGTATVTAAGRLDYVPLPNYSGADSIGISVRDDAGGQATGTVTVTVNAVDDAPQLATTQLVVDEDVVLDGELTGTDVEGSTFTFEYLTPVQHGSLTLAPSGSFSYTPAPDYAGSDQFVVRLAEAGGVSSQQTVSVQVRAVNDAPSAADDMLRVGAAGGAPIVLQVLANDVDMENDVLMPQVVTQPRGGTVVVDATTREMRFEPENGYVGPIDFTYRVSDGAAESNTANVNAYIGEAETVAFLSDYTTPGTLEVHLFDGLEVRRVNDDLPAGRTLTSFSVSDDGRTLAYVLDDEDAERVYVKPLDGSAPAQLRFTSAVKTVPAERRVSASLNRDGSFLLVRDGWAGPLKPYFVVDAVTGTARRVASSMPGVVDTRIVMFHPYEPQLLLLQGQTSGSGPADLANRATSAFIADSADPRTITQIGHTYPPGECGSGEGLYVGDDARYIYHAEYLCARGVINIIAYDREQGTETYVVREAAAPDRGLNGVLAPLPAVGRLCFAFYLPDTTASDGPARFYAMDTADPSSAMPVSPVHERTAQCTMAADDRTMVYRLSTAGIGTQLAYSIDSVTPGTPALLAPAAEIASEQGAWQVAFGAPRVAIVYFDSDGVSGFAPDQLGRYYTMSVNGAADHFLFSDTYVPASVGNAFTASSEDGAFILYARPRGGVSALEIMSTRVLNLSIPLSRASETRGVQSMRWLRTGTRQN